VLRRTLAVVLTGLLLLLAIGFPSVRAQTPKDFQAVAKARAKVQELGVGSNSRVEVKLRDNTKLKGYISSVEKDSFAVTDSKSGTSQTIAYADVTEVRKSGGGLSTKTWIILGAATAGSVITWIAVKPALCDGGAQTRFPC
jgi:hypothetical protein